jgi:hypothetical protein
MWAAPSSPAVLRLPEAGLSSAIAWDLARVCLVIRR